MRKIILASQSPRRKELMEKLIGKNFEIIESKYEEDNSLDMNPVELALLHSLNKGKEVADSVKGGIVVSADTFVVLEGEVLGKPIDQEDAKNMLRKISGQWVDVISGIAVIDVDNNKTLQESELTRVKMKKMSEKEIEDYVKSGEPMDKAGSFGAQDKGAVFVEKEDGCHFNVVGLPLFKLNNMLEKVGVNIFNY